MARALALRVGLIGTPLIRSRRRARACVLLIALIACVAQRGDGEPKRLEFIRLPHYIFDNTAIAFDTRALPATDLRLLRVAAINELGDTERSSDMQLEGASAMAVWRVEWNPLAAGHYVITARTYDEAGAECARTAEYWGTCPSVAAVNSNLEVRGFSESYSPFDDPQ